MKREKNNPKEQKSASDLLKVSSVRGEKSANDLGLDTRNKSSKPIMSVYYNMIGNGTKKNIENLFVENKDKKENN